MSPILRFFGIWALIALACGALWAFVRSDSAVRRLDMLERGYPVWTWLTMVVLLVSVALALVYINTEAVPILSQGTHI